MLSPCTLTGRPCKVNISRSGVTGPLSPVTVASHNVKPTSLRPVTVTDLLTSSHCDRPPYVQSLWPTSLRPVTVTDLLTSSHCDRSLLRSTECDRSILRSTECDRSLLKSTECDHPVWPSLGPVLWGGVAGPLQAAALARSHTVGGPPARPGGRVRRVCEGGAPP